MSFGFSVTDCLAALSIAKNIHNACKDGPVEYREICNEARSLTYAFQSLCDDAQDPGSSMNRKGLSRRKELDEIISNCERTLQDLQTIVDRHSSLNGDDGGKLTRTWHAYQVGSSDLDSLRGKLTFHTSTISMFLLSLEGSAISRIETKLDGIYARMLQYDAAQARQSSASLNSIASTTSLLSQIDTNEDDVWAMLKRELLAEGISMAHVMANRGDIIDYIKSLLENGLPSDVDGASTDGSVVEGQQLSEHWPLPLFPFVSTHQISEFNGTVAEIEKVKVERDRAQAIVDELEEQISYAHAFSTSVPPTNETPNLIKGEEAQIRRMEKHLFAEKQLTGVLEEALVDLETQGNKIKLDRENWKNKCWEYENELAHLRTENQEPAKIQHLRQSRRFSLLPRNFQLRSSISR